MPAEEVMNASFDNLNRLLSQQPGGPMVFAGTVSEPAAVTVQGVPATVPADHTSACRCGWRLERVRSRSRQRTRAATGHDAV